MKNFFDKFFDKTFVERKKDEKHLADLIFKNPFHNGLAKFSRSDFLTLILAIESNIADEKGWYDFDAEDTSFMCKCFLVESLVPDYFDLKEKKRK